MPNDAYSSPPEPLPASRRLRWKDAFLEEAQRAGGLVLPLPEAYMVDATSPELLGAAVEEGSYFYDLSRDQVEDESPLRNMDLPAGNALAVMARTAPRVKDGIAGLWHYTDAHGFTEIIKSGTVWASSLASLNDAAEYGYGQALLDDVMNEVEDSDYVDRSNKERLKEIVRSARELVPASDLFSLSASTAGHSLAQWRAYGGGQGHAIVLDPSGPLSVVSPDEPQESEMGHMSGTWRHVLYDLEEQRKLLREVLGMLAFLNAWEAAFGVDADDWLLTPRALLLTEAVIYCKEPSFREEGEVRMVFHPARSEAVKFRAGSTGVTPYVAITGGERPFQRTRAEAGKLPLVAAAVGPFAARDASTVGAKRLLANMGYADIPIETSTSTLR